MEMQSMSSTEAAGKNGTASPEVTVIYKSENILVSALRERTLAQVWKDWSPRNIEITSDGILTWEKPSRSKALDQHKLRLKSVELKLMTDTNLTEEVVNHGVTMKCQTLEGVDTFIRFIFNQLELDRFLAAVKQVSEDHNVERMSTVVLDVEANKGFSLKLRPMRSIMRRAVTQAFDRQSRVDHESNIKSKRGALKWLPVLGANDLIHGSWWFVIGSIGIMLTCVVVIINKYYHFLTDDDSTLTKVEFIANWILLLISGFFSMIGSLFFVRAFHEDPPINAMFANWYHLQNDELVGSWFFFLMTVPFVPYCLIYLSEASYNSLTFLVGLVIAVIACLSTLLFVRSCYPSDREYKNILLPISDYVFCCWGRKFRETHLANDWLGGSWLFLWGTFIVCIPTAAIMMYFISESNSLQIFIYSTSLIENIAFLLGSAYFVAGSYPETSSSKE